MTCLMSTESPAETTDTLSLVFSPWESISHGGALGGAGGGVVTPSQPRRGLKHLCRSIITLATERARCLGAQSLKRVPDWSDPAASFGEHFRMLFETFPTDAIEHLSEFCGRFDGAL